MSTNELIEHLERQGYTSYPVPRIWDGVVWTASKRMPEGSLLCETNTYKTSWHIKLYDYMFSGSQHQSVEIEICGEYNDIWYSLKAYSLSPEETIQKLTEVESSLLNCWEGVSNV